MSRIDETDAWQLPADARTEWPEPENVSDVVLDAMKEGFYVVDRRGQFRDWNDQFKTACGYTDAELADLDPLELVAPEDRRSTAESLAMVVEGAELTRNVTIVTKDGRRVPHEVTAAPLSDSDGAVWGIVGTARNVAEREETKAALRERTRMFSTLVSNLPGMVYQCRNEPDWPMQFVSDGCRELTGYDPQRLEAGDVVWGEEIIHPDDREQMWAEVQSALEAGEPFEVTYRVVTADGETRWAWEQGREVDGGDSSTLLEGFITDITEQKRHEQDLQRYKQLIETVGDGVYVLDEERCVQQANDVLLEMLGYEREELLGTHLRELVAEEDAETSAKLREQLEESEQTVATIEGKLRRKDGSRIAAEGRFSVLSAEDSSTIGLVRDISDRRERAELLEDLHEGTRELMAAETVNEVAETAASVAYQHFESATAGTRLLRDEQLEMTTVATDDDRLDSKRPPIKVGEGLVGQAYERGECVVYDDLSSVRTEADYGPVQSAMILPVEGYGTIGLASTEVDAFDRIDLELGRLFAADVEAAFQRADREQQLRKRTRELKRYETLVETMSDGVYMTDENNRIRLVNDAMADLLGHDSGELLGSAVGSVGDEEAAQEGTELRRELLETENAVNIHRTKLRTADGERVPVENRFSLLPTEERDAPGSSAAESTDEFAGTVGVVRDVTEQQKREQQLRTQRDELETLNQINELVRETIGALASAATREEIEQTACERLADSSLYRFAFVGTEPPDEESVDCRTWAGEGIGYLDAVQIPASTDDEEAGPAARTLETGEITVTGDIEADPQFEPYREQALDHGFRSLAVVPLSHSNVVHGILAVYADRPDAFSDRELNAFEVLGDMIGFAISATQDRRLIESDVGLELRFRLTQSESPFVQASTEFGCTLELLGSAKTSGEEMLHYISVSGADPNEVRRWLVDRGEILKEIRLVRAEGTEGVFEVRLVESVAKLLLESGVRPVTIQAEDGTAQVVGHAPRDVDIRTVTERLEDVHGNVSLVSKREFEHWDQSPDTVREEVVEKLTDRQQAALNAAYFGGYFDWPRDSTAEEIADSLDISSPTLHQHLRHAHRKLVESYLVDVPGMTA